MHASRRHFITGALAAGATAPFAQFGNADAQANTATALSVVATTGMITDMARVIGGEAVAVKGLMGAGVDPHAYRQTRSDIVAMRRSGLVLRHGMFLEAQMEKFFETLSAKVPVTAVGEAVPVSDRLAHDTYADKYDPHVWMDPDLWLHAVEATAQALSIADPSRTEGYRERAAAYSQAISLQAEYSREILGAVTPQRRVLVTAHDAFGYFGRAYGFDVVGIQGISTESEAGLNRISELVDLLVERGISGVFVETSVSDRNIRALIEGAASRGHQVEVGGELFSDAMGPEGTYEGTYLGMIDHNTTTIARALGANAPAEGRLGRLAQL
ncbi:MAG: zinc ABC transporter substrate-binding protein [Pseudomonadota bacterium]